MNDAPTSSDTPLGWDVEVTSHSAKPVCRLQLDRVAVVLDGPAAAIIQIDSIERLEFNNDSHQLTIFYRESDLLQEIRLLTGIGLPAASCSRQ